jgi:hypothetical protein
MLLYMIHSWSSKVGTRSSTGIVCVLQLRGHIRGRCAQLWYKTFFLVINIETYEHKNGLCHTHEEGGTRHLNPDVTSHSLNVNPTHFWNHLRLNLLYILIYYTTAVFLACVTDCDARVQPVAQTFWLLQNLDSFHGDISNWCVFWLVRLLAVSRPDTLKSLQPFKPKFTETILNNSVRTSKRTPHFTITRINWLTLFKFNPLKTKLV